VYHATIWHERVELLESQRYLPYLKLGLDDILWIGYKPGKKAANSSGYYLGYHTQIICAL
jgi:hypothetical protein